jgi:hypothetical protein
MSPWREASNQPPVRDSMKAILCLQKTGTASFGSQRVSERWHEHALFPVKVVTILLISVQYKQQEFSQLLDYKSLENTERPGGQHGLTICKDQNGEEVKM